MFHNPLKLQYQYLGFDPLVAIRSHTVICGLMRLHLRPLIGTNVFNALHEMRMCVISAAVFTRECH